nr:response regulator [Deltaproteobacteria bacterium]
LAGGIAHDFNNILSPIIINTELALMDIPEGSTLILNLNEVLKASKRAKDLVMQILTFSRQTEQERVPLNLSSIVKEATKLLRSSLPATIEIRQNILTKSDTILADPTQIHQVLMNLCTNAYHAMREKGGVLEVSLSDVYHDEDSAMNIDSFKPGPYLRLAVKDTGTGINPGIVDKIFEPYLTTKEKGVGTGLGLAVVDGIVKNHGGSIQVESAQGEGATFKVFFPKIDLTAIEKIDTREPMPTGNERILFVDDEAVIANVGKQMLERLGYDVITRTGSIDALEHFRSQPDLFDLVITDVTMPNMTGVELSKEIMSIRPDIPVILSTGFSEKIDEKKALELGVRAFLMKPVVMSEMANTIRKVLDEK